MGQILKILDRAGDAEIYHGLALKLLEEEENVDLEIKVLNSLGDLLLDKNKYSEALHYLQKSRARLETCRAIDALDSSKTYY